ncbi:MAG: nitrous oxide reductase accessory protein NosL [Cyclobacteriaceae bacterium]|nr:nitrous oxide reductase accessory protein NosL [Cyclobacteriaceae bacterium]
MKRIATIVIFAALIFAGTACTVKPEAIRYGTDNCHACKMTLMDKRFGAEVVTEKGKIYKFDDVNCLVNFLNSGDVQERDVKYTLVTDFSQPESLIDAATAFYLKSPEIKSPMASQVAAFENNDVFKEHKKEFDGFYLTWGELITQYK